MSFFLHAGLPQLSRTLSLKPTFLLLPQVCGDSSKQHQSLVQMHFQGLHLYTVVVYDFAQVCQVMSGNQKSWTCPRKRVCSTTLSRALGLLWLYIWGGANVTLDLLCLLTLKPFLSLQVADLADLAQLVESCKSTVVWMLEALQGLSGRELTDYLGMTG